MKVLACVMFGNQSPSLSSERCQTIAVFQRTPANPEVRSVPVLEDCCIFIVIFCGDKHTEGQGY